MKIIFLGTPKFSSDVMEIVQKSEHKIIAVVCQPDMPNSRGNKIEICPAKQFAIKNNIPVYQFKKIRKEGVDVLKGIDADIMVTAAYGQLLSQAVLSTTSNGVINVHGSLLPKYRGASPVQSAILNGETETGITIMKTEIGMDDGDILLSKKVIIDNDDTTETLMNKMANVGGELLVEALDKIENGTIQRTPQEHNDATFTKMLKKESAYLDFNCSAVECRNKIRAYNPNPIIRIKINGSEYKIFSADACLCDTNATNGEILFCDVKRGFVIKCANNTSLSILEIQGENGKRLKIKDFLNGKRFTVGTILESYKEI